MRYSEAKVEIWGSDEYMIAPDAMATAYDGPRHLAVDLGAHVGTRSIWLATDGGFKRVYAVEMQLDNFELLVKNIKRNGLQGIITPIHVAVSDRAELITIKAGGVNKGQFSIAYDSLGFGTCETAMAVSLYELLSGILTAENADVIDFVKMDIEGSEYKVFADRQRTRLALNLFNDCVRFLFLERHGPNEQYFTKRFFEELGYDPKDPQKQLLHTLRACGFSDVTENSIGQLMMYNSAFTKETKAA